MTHDCVVNSEYQYLRAFDDRTHIFQGICSICQTVILVTRKLETHNEFDYQQIINRPSIEYKNDRFTKLICNINHPASLIVCNQITQLEKDKYLTPREYKKILETFQDYQKHIHSKVINENVPWIENILN